METDCLILLLSANKIRVWRKMSKNINEDAAAIMAVCLFELNCTAKKTVGYKRGIIICSLDWGGVLWTVSDVCMN